MVAKAALVIVPLLLSELVKSAEAQNAPSGTFTLAQSWGRAPNKRCDLRASFSGAHGSANLTCTPNVSPPKPDFLAERKLSQPEITTLQTLAKDSHLYEGGHFGTGWGSNEGPFETLTASCCGQSTTVVLVTIGNDTFEEPGARRRLLELLRTWHDNLRVMAVENPR